MTERDHKAEYQRLSPESKARKNARNKLPEVIQQKKEYYQRDRHLIKERYHQNFAIVVKFLEERDNHEGCIKCGNKERLELDHINQQDKSWNPKRSMCSKVLSENFWKEINKCQLLCYDCHKQKTIQQLRKTP